MNTTTTITEYDNIFNQLEFSKTKLEYPQIFNEEETNQEIENLVHKENNLRKVLQETTQIENIRSAMFQQLDAYTKYLNKPRFYNYSRSQGMSGHTFYVMPLLNIRDILFRYYPGICGVELYLTMDEKDSVSNLQAFVEVLEQSKKELLDSLNLYDLYQVYQGLSKKLKKDFYNS